jgi:hypothetical protein
MTKKIPWVTKLRQIAREYSKPGDLGRSVRSDRLIAQYHAIFQRLMDAADFTGVKWDVDIYWDNDDGVPRNSNKGPWQLSINARFNRNDTRWMRTIRALRCRATGVMACWGGEMRFRTKFGGLDVITVYVGVESVRIAFSNRISVNPYCKAHHVRDIDSTKKTLEYSNVIMVAQRSKVSLDQVLRTIKK